MMTHTYHISGMTCSGCEAKVKSSLLKMPDVLSATVSKDEGKAVIEMSEHIPLQQFQQALGGADSKYQISAESHIMEESVPSGTWLHTYKPILLIFAFITGITLLVQIDTGKFHFMLWMRQFMAGFFLVFSFFKFLNLKGFADSYAMYDVIAKRWNNWGYIYAFIELLLGIAFLTGFEPMLTSSVTFVVMAVSIIGVLQSVLGKRKIKCACLGDVFNLPMSTVTIVEDGLMILMSAVMILAI